MKNLTHVKRTYPWGLYARNGHKALFSDGRIRAVEMAQTADTFFSVPATARINGKLITGYVTTEEYNNDHVFCFRLHDCHTGTLNFPKWPASYTPEMTTLLSKAFQE